jgi:hypothetical protein
MTHWWRSQNHLPEVLILRARQRKFSGLQTSEIHFAPSVNPDTNPGEYSRMQANTSHQETLKKSGSAGSDE